MQIDDCLTLAQAARTAPGKPSPATIWRWITKGCNGVKLQALRFGDRWFTTYAWLEDFGRRVAKASKTRPTPQRRGVTDPPTRTDIQRRNDIERAEEQCRKAGI